MAGRQAPAWVWGFRGAGGSSTTLICEPPSARAPASPLRVGSSRCAMNPPDNTLSAAGSSDEVARLRVELLQKNRELQSLQEEIEETNRGVVALYAELDEQAELLKRS